MRTDNIPYRPCPVCGARRGNALAHLDYALFDDLALPGRKTLFCCDACKMIYDDVTFTETDLQEYYRCNEHYAVANSGGTGGMSEDNKGRYDRIIDSLFLPCDGLVLDFGCGQGGFMARCIERGWRAVGIEPSERSRAVGLSEGLKIYASLESFQEAYPKEKVTAVLMSHVLEHMIAPLKALSELSICAPDSLIYLEVPDAAAYLAPGLILWHELYFEHLCHFRSHDLLNLAGLAGIECNKQGEVAFSEEQSDVRCLFIKGRLGANPRSIAIDERESLSPLPDVPGKVLVPDNASLALWGVSQYAMLLLGSCPGLTGKVERLFDASPAKIGRRINGIAIEPSSRLKSLSPDYTLLIPRSAALGKMCEILKGTDFKGNTIVV